MANVMEKGRYAVKSDGVQVEVVGRRPENEPYIWIGTEDRYLGSIDEAEMRRLRTAINEALGE